MPKKIISKRNFPKWFSPELIILKRQAHRKFKSSGILSLIVIEICNLDILKGPGPDSVPPALLRACSFGISKPLHIMFNFSLRCGSFPSVWKSS